MMTVGAFIRTDMQHGPLTRVFTARGFAHRIFHFRFVCVISCIGVISVAGFLVASCGSHGKSIIVDSEIFIPDVKSRVDAIARMRDGGFVVTGIGLTAWVVATDSHGNLLWQYNDPFDDKNPTISQSVPQTEFHGAVPLANGNVLFCGTKYKSGRTDNLIVVLDNKGQLVDRRVQVPNDDPLLVYSRFPKCFSWNDGIVLIGDASDGSKGLIWIVELDHNGVKQRQALIDHAPAASSTAFAVPSFVFTAWESTDNFRIVRTNPKGETLAKRVIAGQFIMQLRSEVETSNTSILIYRAGRATLYTLDEHLQDVQPPKQVEGDFDPQAGCGYVLADGSIVLFGRSSNAAIAWISQQGTAYASRVFDPKYTSFSVSDAVPISAGQFVTVRGSVSQNPKDQGLVMSWVTTK
jgi:hypothetical protein